MLTHHCVVTEFSKKTGDYGVLSQPDLRVLALTYTLEKRENGDANIRTEPLTVSCVGCGGHVDSAHVDRSLLV